MSRLPPTPEQERAITATGADLCVVASAGTGKTFTLTQRILRRVVHGRVPLRKILAVTFTEKAAAEMKERLAAALEEAQWPDARQEVEGAAVSTVHAFCARILREHAVAAGVDPGFGVLDEMESERLLAEALDRLTDELRDTVPADFALLATLGGDDPAGTLLEVHGHATASGLPVEEYVRRVPRLPPAAAAMSDVRAALAGVTALAGKGTASTQEQVADLAAAERSMPPDDAPPAALEAAVEAVRARIKLHCSKEVKPALTELRLTCEEALPVLAEHAMAPLREVLARAVVRLDDLYDEAKGRGEHLDFCDLERRTVGLLESRADVRDAVRARFPEVLVDEFQDTNPVQARLVDLLRTPGGLFVVGDPKQSIYGFRGADVGVFRDRLAAVEAEGRGGVVRLRHSHRARPELLGFVERLFAGGVGGGEGALGDVSMVARRDWAPAAKPCVEIAGFPCERMPDGREAEAAWIADRISALCDGSFRIAAPTAADPRATRPAGFGDVAVLLRATTNVKTLEQALVAREVPYLVVKGRGFFRAREVIDFARLVECVDDPRDDLALAAVLRSPACGVSDDGLFALSAARRRTGDRRAEPGTREREPLGDVLAGWAAGRREVDGLGADDAAALRRFAVAFLGLRARRGVEGVASLVERAFREFRLDVLALGRPNGRQRAANLRKVRSLARDADAAGRSLAEFSEELRELRAAEVREAEAAVAGGARGAVSVMTVHAAKGLEFPVVFVPDAGHAPRPHADGVVSTHRGGVGLRDRADAPSGAKPWAFATLVAEKTAAELAESERLLYVAVTRASDHLVVTGAVRELAEGSRSVHVWWDRLDAALGGAAFGGPADVDVGPGCDEARATRAVVRVHGGWAAGDLEAEPPRTLLGREAQHLAAGRVRDLPGGVRPEAAAAAEALVAEATRAAPRPDGTPYAANVSALTAFVRCPQEFRLRYVVGVPEDAPARHFGARTAFDADEALPEDRERPGDADDPDVAPDARALGRAVHAALERLVPSFELDVRGEVETALRAETGGAEPDPAQVADLVRWIGDFRASDVGREVARAPRADVRREQSFLLRSGRTVIRGQIDLLWRAAHGPREDGGTARAADPAPASDAGWTVVDYKTGAPREPRAEHALQMRLYALGVAGVTGTLPSRLLLWSLPHGRAVPVRFDEEDRLEVHALLAEFAERSSRRAWEPRRSPPCAACGVRAACRFAAAPAAR